jgi:hypothetical protein
MMVSTVSTPLHVAPTQVWACVPTALQQRTSQLLTRLAVNWVVAQARRSDPGPSSQEVAPALPPPPSNIRPAHLERPAFIDVRQSTLFQVREHPASTARQYALAQRARDLGWPRAAITIIDQDQGHSGASTAGRDGVPSLSVEVGLGPAGAVLSLAVSRLARSSSDWDRCLARCALPDTLVIDAEGGYDPGPYNDRWRLGCKGTMSEAE